MESVSDSATLKCVLIIILILLLIWALYPTQNTIKAESFNPDTRTVLNSPKEYQQKDVPLIQPPSYDAETYAIQSGTGFIPQKNYFTPWGTMVKSGDIMGADGSSPVSGSSIDEFTMNFNQCSPACCSDQWPVPFKLPTDKTLCNSEDKFVPSSYYCNNGWQNSGCLCMKKDQSDFLQTRGANTDY